MTGHGSGTLRRQWDRLEVTDGGHLLLSKFAVPVSQQCATKASICQWNATEGPKCFFSEIF